MDVSAFRRVLVAGFIGGGTDDVDANLETVRLLRSQLRSKSALRVIEADVLPLVELAVDKAKAGTPGTPRARAVDGDHERRIAKGRVRRADCRARTGTDRSQPLACRRTRRRRKRRSATRRTSRSTSRIFADVAFWKKLGEEYQNPLIVTGTVLFTPQQTAGFVTRNVEQSTTSSAAARVVPSRLTWSARDSSSRPKFIFIDGRTGATLYSESLHEEILYSSQQNTPALSSYFELMDKVIPVFLGTLSTQKIRGTRVLLR